MFCIYCGSALPSDAIFCNSCGKRQNLTTPSISTNTIRPEAVLPEQPASSVEIVADNPPFVQERAAQTDMFSADQQTPPLLSGFLVNGTRLTAAPLPTTRQSFGPILAGAGGILALLAFFSMPYLSITIGIFGTLSLTGQQLANYGTQAANNPFSEQLKALQLLWLEPIVAALVIGIAAYQLFKNYQTSTDGPTTKGGAAWLITIAGVTLTALLIRYIIDAQPLFPNTQITIASFYSSGFWVYSISMVAVLIGGIIEAKTSS